MKLRVCTIIGTRPETIRLACIIPKFDQFFDHILVHTGQNFDYELSQVFFDDLDLRLPDVFLECGANSSTPSQAIAKVLSEVDRLLEETKPDAVLVLGDTNSALSTISAKKRKIPIFHMEAGNRCFDERVPEEINRRIVDHISDVNLTYSAIAREYLVSEGLPPDRVIKTGSPLFEVLEFYKSKINNSTILEDLKIAKNQYFVVSCHREENVESDDRFKSFVDVLNVISERYGYPVIVSTHPRIKKRIQSDNISFHKNVRLERPFQFSDYIALQTHAKAVLSDREPLRKKVRYLIYEP